MDIIDSATLASLVDTTSAPCVSIYMPTHRAGHEIAQDPIRLKNLLGEAHGRLGEREMRSTDADAMLAPAGDLLDRDIFWQHAEDGLAIFLTPDEFRLFRLPTEFDDLVVVGDRFHVKPLLPVMSRGERFFVLALSQNQVRLLWAGRYGISEIELEDMPTSLQDALWFQDRERRLQYHGADRAGPGRVVATFHGHAEDKDLADEQRIAFFRAVDRALDEIVTDDTPLVLAGVDDNVAMFRHASRHPNIIEDAISGNPDNLDASELHTRAWDIARPSFLRERDADAADIENRTHPIAEAVDSIVEASVQARIGALFVAVDREVWGTADMETGEAVIHDTRRPGDRDLLDAAVIGTWKHGGRVHATPADEVPLGGPAAALLRF